MNENEKMNHLKFAKQLFFMLEARYHNKSL